MASLKELILQCKRCSHRWLRRTLTPPKQCPACKTTFWNQPRVRKIAHARRAVKRG
jgi:predicted Zn-ribbon and HTH transcriptional regulator